MKLNEMITPLLGKAIKQGLRKVSGLSLKKMMTVVCICPFLVAWLNKPLKLFTSQYQCTSISRGKFVLMLT